MPIFDCVCKSNPVCPYCGEEQNMDELQLGLEDGQTRETVCQNTECELPFMVTVYHNVRYDTNPIDPAAVREYCIASDLEIPDCVKSA